MRYLQTLLLSAILSFALVWAWVVAMPMTFMDAEYPSWVAKDVLMDRCDLGDVVVLGDSRAAADILPERMPFRMTNLAVGGGEAIEAYAALTRILRCSGRPRLVVVSLDPGHFVRPDLFWERSVRYGFMAVADIATLRVMSRDTDDWSVYGARNAEGLPTLLRDWLYRIHFPPLYFASLAHGRGLFRSDRNQHTLAATLAARGHYYFGTGAGSDSVAFDGHLPAFAPLPILDAYFNRLLSELDRRGIEIRFVAMPVNQATWNEVQPGVRDQFAAYLARYERRYPHFHVAGSLMPHWPDRFFGDMFCHLNPEGAERFSDELAQRLQDAPPSTQNDAQNGWLSDTAPDASARVVPISKRGS
jgi:hypothetical protein